MDHDELQGLKVTLESSSDEMLMEVIRQAEVFLDSQLRAALASDQRAITFASVVSAASAVLIGAVVTLAATDPSAISKIAAIVPLLGCFMCSIVCAFLVSRPTKFHYGGNNPRYWRKDIENKLTLQTALAGQAHLYALGISENSKLLSTNAKLMRYALTWAVAGLAAGAIALIVLVSS